MIQNTARPSTVSTLDLEQGAATQQESSTSTSGVKAACTGLAAVLFAVGAVVCIVKAFQQGQEHCSDSMQAVNPCSDTPPSFGLLATGIGLAIGAVVSSSVACNLFTGKPVSNGVNASGARTHQNHGPLWMGSGLNFGTQSAAGAFGPTGGAGI